MDAHRDAHTDPSQQDAPPCSQHRAQPCSHCGDRSSSSTKAAQGTRQRHGRHQGTAWQGTSSGWPCTSRPIAWERPRSSPPAQLECEMWNHNSSVFIPAPCKSKQRTEPESKRIRQVFLSGPQDAPVATQWLGHSELVFCGPSLLSKRNYGHPFLTSFPPAHPFLPQKGPGVLCPRGSGWEPPPLPGAEGALPSPRRGLAGLK